MWRREWIRTHGELAPTAVFKTAALNHSAISPGLARKRPGRSVQAGARGGLRRRDRGAPDRPRRAVAGGSAEPPAGDGSTGAGTGGWASVPVRTWRGPFLHGKPPVSVVWGR